MRLTQDQLDIIVSAFEVIFNENDQLWLFGSRVNNNLKGGDIDLYVETNLTESKDVFDKKIMLLVKLSLAFGEQKIDLIINQLSEKKDLPIYLEAKKHGIKLYG